jgi:hypothetical protein
MKENTKARNRWLNIRVNEDEYKKIDGYSKATTCHTVSEYSRLVLLKKPVTIKYRNQSADEFLAEMIRLKNELHAIGNNYNQVVHKLHTLDRVPEIKSWLFSNEITRHAFLNKIDEITREVNKIYLIWSQK